MVGGTAGTPRGDAWRGWLRIVTASFVVRGVTWATVASAVIAPPCEVAPATAQDLTAAQDAFRVGDYEASLAAAEAALSGLGRGTAWHLLRIKSAVACGRYADAGLWAEEAVAGNSYSLELRWAAREAFRRSGDSARAQVMLDEIARKANEAPWLYSDAENLLSVGRALFASGAEPKDVMERYFRRAATEAPDHADAHVAVAELALDKHDDGLASDALRRALALDPDDVHAHYLMAHAFAESDPEETQRSIEQALAINPRHVPCLLLEVDFEVRAEQFDAAKQSLDEILTIEPGRWEAWAYKAVLASLHGEESLAAKCRETALTPWSDNPGVDHLIGRELSEHYRFAKGAEHQRRALALDASYVPARFQLAQDLLRLGQDDEGWAMADAVLSDDEFHVVAYNLMTLHDRMAAYRTLERDGFRVRMEAREAAVYGDAVLDLLVEARDVLCPKYEVTLPNTVVLELFEEQKDFAIRTFGLPGGAGYLGVCFGDVITMNSPASQGTTPTNWKSVLWHEFCHVVTLNKTKNTMPRWLSEGLSVYEERQRDPSWGQSMTHVYREMILAGETPPVSGLSAAFMRPQSPMHLNFAYYVSSMVVEFVLREYGHEALVQVLSDLAGGERIEFALGRNLQELSVLDAAFDADLRALAEAFGEGDRWAEPDDEMPFDEWFAAHPDSVPGLLKAAVAAFENGRFDDAVGHCERVLALDPTRGEAYELLAAHYVGVENQEREVDVLRRWVTHDASALPPRLRLLELESAEANWEGLASAARLTLAVQPMLREPHRALMEAAQQIASHEEVLQAGGALIALDEPDLAGIHYARAKALAAQGHSEEATREVLRALEEAPRFRDAHRLLLELAAGRADSEGVR